MLSFKEFLYEAPRKPKEPDWPDADPASGYGKLRDLQKYSIKLDGNKALQLFVPKHRDPKVELEREQTRRYIQTKRELETDLKEDRPPILSAYHESPPGDNKPHASFWTSTAIKQRDGTYTSDWYRLVQQRFKTWQTDYGYLFEVVDNPTIFSVKDAEQYYAWALEQNRLTKKKLDFYHEYSRDDARHRFPWDSLAKHFDAVHCPYVSRGGYGEEDFDRGWDVESTAWFKTDFLKYRGAVRLANFGDDDDD